MAEASLDALFLEQAVDAVSQTYQAIHTRETVSVDEALFCQEVVLKKAALFYLKFDTGIHIACHDIQYVRKFFLLEILDILCALCDIAKHQTAKSISAAAKQQAIVAACNNIILTKLALEHLVVCEARLCAVHCAVDRFECKIIRSDILVVLEA